MGTDILKIWKDSLYHKDPEFEKHLVFFNFKRFWIGVFSIMAATFVFLSLRLALYSQHHNESGYHAFIALNIIVLGLSFMYFVLMRKYRPDSPDDIKQVHSFLIYSAMFLFIFFMSSAAGFEYVEKGTFTRLFFALLSLCSIFVFNWFILFYYLVTSFISLFLTVFLAKGELLTLGSDNMHLPVLLLVFWFVSRACYMATVKDFLTQKKLEEANEDLKTENTGRLKALDDLKKSEGYLKTLFEKAPDAYVLYDIHQGIFTRINAYAENLFDYTNEEVAGKRFRDIAILTTENQRLIDGMVDETLEKGFAGPYEFDLAFRNGLDMVVEIRSSLTSLSGRTMLLATARDVTSRKHNEEQLLKSNIDLEERVKREISDHKHTENVLRKTEKQALILIEKMNDGFVMFDSNLRVNYANERLCSMLDVTANDILGKPFIEYVQQDCVSEFEDHLNATVNPPRTAVEIVLKKSGGGRLHAFVSPQALYGEAGRVESRFSVITDISRIKSMEKALRESEEMKRALLDASQDCVAMLSPDGTILMANEMLAGNLNHHPDQLKGRNIFSFLKPDLTPDHQAYLLDLAGKTEPSIVENTYCGKYFLIHIYPIFDNTPTNERIAMFARDITDLKEAEKHIYSLSQELIKVQESERQRISRDLHDEVAQELASLKILCETLFEDPQDIPENVKNKTVTMSTVLHHTIMSVRDMAYNLRPPDLDQLGLVRTIGNYCEDFSERNRIKVDISSAGVSRYTLTADAEINLYRIIQEALHNIAKYARADRITIRLIASFPDIILRIVDNGNGFDLPKRMREANQERRMGLRSMEERARLLSGRFTIRSQEGRGTTIAVEIPISGNTVDTGECA